MQPLTISQIDFAPFEIPFLEPLVVAGHTLAVRKGFYLSIKTTDGFKAQSELAPLEGVSPENSGRLRHDIKQIRAYAEMVKLPRQKDGLLEALRHEPHLLNACGSMRFAVESAFFMLAAQAAGQNLVEFLGGHLKDVRTAVLLQGSHQKVMADFKKFLGQGTKVFKLKVGDRNIALDVKKVNDIRVFLGEESYLRLDANRQWSLKEACIFAELVGNQRIDFIEEPVNDPGHLDAFYEKTRMRLALDESLNSSLASHEGVVAYVLKPMILGLIPTLDWIGQARLLKRKAIISSAYESPVGFNVLTHLACLTDQIAGLDTQRWFKT